MAESDRPPKDVGISFSESQASKSFTQIHHMQLAQVLLVYAD